MTDTTERKEGAEKAQFGIHPNSIDANLHRLPSKVQDAYKRNRARFDADQAAMRQWARAGFVAGEESADE